MRRYDRFWEETEAAYIRSSESTFKKNDFEILRERLVMNIFIFSRSEWP